MLRACTEKHSEVPLVGALPELAGATPALRGSATTSSTRALTAKVWNETKKVQ